MTQNKPVTWLGDSLDLIRTWSKDARRQIGFEVEKLCQGKQPSDFKPMKTIGPGVEEMRIWDDERKTYRVIYTARFSEALYVLHAFEKTSQKTSTRDLNLAKRRFSELKEYRK